MKTITEIKALLAKYKGELIKKYSIKELGIFGSYVRNEQAEKSDLDILVKFDDNTRLSLLDFVGLELELSDLLGVKVDLVEKKYLKPFIGQHILKEVIYI